MKSPRFPYFDFSDCPLDPAALRAHFAESLDAITLCRFSDVGQTIFYNGRDNEQKPITRYYRLEESEQWRWYKSQGYEDGRDAQAVGEGMMFGRLHAHVMKLDAQIFGQHPVGTVVQLITADSIVQAGTMQYNPGLLHTDGRAKQFQAVYDCIDDSALPTRYLKGYAGKDDPLASTLGTIAKLFADQRIHILQRLATDKAYLAALSAAETAARFWTAEPNTIVLRASGTPHMGQIAEVPTRRAHVHMVVARPQP